MKTSVLFSGFVASLALAGCTVAPAASTNETVASETSTLIKAPAPVATDLAAPGNSTFYVVTHQDLRRCAYPMCGGVFVKRVNRDTTTCADGTVAAECYVASLDLATLGLAATTATTLEEKAKDGGVILRGALKANVEGFGRRFGSLVASEAWEGRTGARATGIVSRVREERIFCFMAPCPQYTQQELNSDAGERRLLTIAYGAAESLAAEINPLLSTRDGVLFAGTTTAVGPETTLAVHEVYTKVVAGAVASEGETCGTRGALECAPNLYCNHAPAAQCGRADAPGTCQKKPQICYQIYRPVCGCDGKTYSNDCVAASAGVSVDHEGACPTGGEGETCGTLGAATCADGLFCDFPAESACGRADGPGVCHQKTHICTMNYNPVCGCDHKTYGNACAAHAAGVSVESLGECH